MTEAGWAHSDYVGWSFVGVGQAVHLDCDDIVPEGAAIDVEELLTAIDEHECDGLAENSQ